MAAFCGAYYLLFCGHDFISRFRCFGLDIYRDDNSHVDGGNPHFVCCVQPIWPVQVTPVNKIKYGEFPTKADIDRGLKRFTFNFDFVRRNAKRKENFTNQDINEKAIKKEIKKKVSQKTDELVEKLDIQVD